MRWRTGRRSTNVEDRRGRRLGGGLKLGGGATLLIIVLALFLGQDPLQFLETAGEFSVPAPATDQAAGITDEQADFISVVLGDTEDTWTYLFEQEGRQYAPPTLVLFSDAVQSACGFNSAAVGPFYCPPDHKVYIDLSFFRDLSRLGGQGDFARAYVLAHEVGHHVQNLLGVSDQVNALQSRVTQAQANALSVRLELQADCLAGVWAHHADRQRQILETGDIEEALATAAAIGDDRLLKMSGRAVTPESFTHGTSEQRARWLRAGLSSGNLQTCDTFSDLNNR
jgi:predicted metalloprotease